jgi:serine/threonine protein kinase
LENIIIDLNNNVKICDFGIGKVINSEDELLYDKCGTPMYMAPEIILSNKKNGYKGFPVDIWSSGITLYIMLSGTLPFTVKNKSIEELSLKDMKNKKESSDLKYQIVNGCPKKIKKISSEAKDLLNGLLNKNPDKRLTCDEILNHPWLKDDINEICDNNKYHLFTKAEMTMMSKTYIDYRKGELEDLRENFTITNLKSDEIRIEEKNISTKSSILAPFNSALNSSSYSSKKDKFDDSNNSKINLENDLIIYNNKVKEYNLNYELNNNQEVDNGMLIKTKSDISSLISDKNSSVISHNDEKNKREKDNNISFESKTILNKIDTNTNENGNYINENNPKTIKILDEIENFGYKKEYVINCVKNNILCHASTIYYLLKNYGDID